MDLFERAIIIPDLQYFDWFFYILGWFGLYLEAGLGL